MMIFLNANSKWLRQNPVDIIDEMLEKRSQTKMKVINPY